MKVLVIGASGHVGSYLVNALVKDNHEVYAVMRGNRKPYEYDKNIWSKVKVYKMDRETLYTSDIFDEIMPDAVCDMIAYDVEGVQKILSKIKNDAFYLQIGSIWTYLNKEYVPIDENHPKNATTSYGINKGKIEDYLLDLCRQKKVRATVLHVGHVSGREWQPINPQGNLDITVFDKLKNGEEVLLPFWGLNTMQHVHSADITKAMMACLYNQDKANGEAFIVCAEKAITLRALCQGVAKYYGKEANLKYVDWEEFKNAVGETNAAITEEHISRSPCCSVEKIYKVLGVKPDYTIMDIFHEYLDYKESLQ